MDSLESDRIKRGCRECLGLEGYCTAGEACCGLGLSCGVAIPSFDKMRNL